VGGGKGGTSTTQNFSSGSSSTTIPPEVLARYNAVNEQAQAAAAQPFQQYGGEFVAPVNQTQQGGINTITGAASSWQPNFNAASSALYQGFGAAYPALQQGQAYGTGLGNQSIALTGQTGAQAQPYNAAAGNLYAQGLGAASPYNAAAGQSFNQGFGAAQPLNQAATGLALAGTGAVNPGALGQSQIQQYEQPNFADVVNPVVAQMQNQFGQQQRDLTGNQILSGSFGSDRGGIGKSTLSNQQDLAMGQTLSGLYQQNYAQALAAAQQQQSLGLGAAQANRAALQQGASQLQGLGQQQFSQGLGLGQAQQGLGQQVYGQATGTGQAVQGLGQQVYGQGLGLAQQYLNAGNTLFGQGNTAAGTYGNLGATQSQAEMGLGTQNLQNYLAQGQAQLGAGTVAQQTQQAQDTALYNQFLQQQGYPFQVAQFLAGIAEGTGALSGSTTTSTGQTSGTNYSPQAFFSDERLKEDIHVIGKTNDGQAIVRYRMKGQPHTQLGLIAQEVLKKHPEAVGRDQGYLTVDYDAATRGAIKRADGGLVPKHYDAGGDVGSIGGSPDMAAILAAQKAMYPGAVNSRGIGTGPRGMQLAPSGGQQMIKGPPVQLPKPGEPPKQEPSTMQSALKTASDAASDIKNFKEAGKDIGDAGRWVGKQFGSGVPTPASSPTPPGSITSAPNPPPTGSIPPLQPSDQAAHEAAIKTALDKAAPPADTGGAPNGSGNVAPTPPPDATPPAQVSGLDASSNIATDMAPPVDMADAGGGLGDLGDLGDLFAKRGGRIKRAGGGDISPYGADSYVPDPDQPNTSTLVGEQKSMAHDPADALPKPAQSGSSGGGGSTFGDALKTAASVASLVALFQRGGRVGRKLGGLAGMVSGSSKPPLFDLVSGDTKDLPDDALASAGLDGFAGGLIPFGRGGRAGFDDGGTPDVDMGYGDEPKPQAREPAVPINAPKSRGLDALDRRSRDIVANEQEATRQQLREPDAPPPVTSEGLKPARAPTGPQIADTSPDAGLGAAQFTPSTPPAAPAENPAVTAAKKTAAAPATATPAPTPAPAQTAPTSPAGPANATQPGGDLDNDTLEKMRSTITRMENASGRYDTVSKPNWNNTWDIGRYQINSANAGPWSEQVLGRRMTPEELRNDPKAQDAIFEYKMKQYTKMFGSPEKAFLAWHGGENIFNQSADKAMTPELLGYGQRAAALFRGEKDPGPGGTQVAANVPADRASAPQLAGTSAVPGGFGDAKYDPYTGRAARDPNAGFFDHGGWLDRNQKEVMSGLSFLGNMLGSPSRTLAGSFGQGLAAGAGTYLSQANKEQGLGQEQQGLGQGQQRIGQEQQRINIANRGQLMNLWSQLSQRAAGFVMARQPVPPDLQKSIDSIREQLARMPVDTSNPPTGGPSGGGSGAGAPAAAPPPTAPSAGPGAAPPPPAQSNGSTIAPSPTNPTPADTNVVPGPTSGGTPAVDKDGLPIVNVNDPKFLEKLDPQMRPDLLAQDAARMAQYDPAKSAELMTRARNLTLQYAQQGWAPGPNNEKVPVPGFAERQSAERRQTANDQTNENESKAVTARQQMLTNLSHITDSLTNYKTGDFNAIKAEIAGKLRGIGFKVPDTASMSPTEFQTMLKSAYMAIINKGQEAGEHNTDALRQQIEHSLPNPEYQPEANKRLLSQMIGQLQWENKHGQELSQALGTNRQLDTNAWNQEWTKNKENDLRHFQDQAYANLGVRGATPPKFEDLKPNHVYVIEPDQLETYHIKPGKFAPADQPVKVRWMGNGWARAQ